MEKVGKQYHCIVIDFNVKSSNAWQDKVFWYKAETDDDTFRFGSKESWDYNDHLVKERALALYAKIKKEQQAKVEMSEWIAKLNEQKSLDKQSKRKVSDRYF
ncbi:MAG: hypothetical protein EOP45_20050 [Sphingobacteriaceae bacterium]|nr:MAG: hypothetical protein EOP45_20050 [Sphingobacteriaceae bacterium]